MIKVILIDIDDTLLDFISSANKALEICFTANRLPYSQNTTETFHRINDGLWKQIERKEITKTEMYGLRFAKILNALGLEYDGKAMEIQFRTTLSGIAEPVKNAYAMLEYLKNKYPLYAASNSSYEHQRKRMTAADMLKFFNKMFVSETVGALKPAKEFFDVCLSDIKNDLGDVATNEIAIIGDSLTSDIAGGKAYGMKTVWFNPFRKPFPHQLAPDHVINDLIEIKNIL